LVTGFLQEAFDSLKLALFVISFASISLVLAGGALHFGAQREMTTEG